MFVGRQDLFDFAFNTNHQKRHIGFFDQDLEPVGYGFQDTIGFFVDQMVKVIQDNQPHLTNLDEVDQA